MMPLLSPFTKCMRSRLFCQMKLADVSITGLQWFILIARLNYTGLRGQLIPIPNPIYIEKKNIGFGTRTTQPAAIL